MGERTRILIVDDDESIRKTLTTILEDEGYKVDTAENGTQAIQKSQTRFYNVALIDIRLSDMEGTKLLAALKETTPKMIKIIITGYPSVQNAVLAVNKNADAYLIKPLDIPALLRIIKTHLDKQRKDLRFTEEKVADFIQTRAKQLEN